MKRVETTVKRRIGAFTYSLGAAVVFALAFNAGFWIDLVDAVGGLEPARLPLLAAALLVLVLFFLALLALASFRWVYKPVLVAGILASSAIGYFMYQYGIVIDRTMVQNVLETDVREAAELVNWQMGIYLGLTGLFPVLLVARARIDYPAGLRGLAARVGVAGGALLLAAIVLLLSFKSLAPAFREHRELRYQLTPMNLVHALQGHMRSRLRTPVAVAALGRDAVKGRTWSGQARPTVVVLVVGETARAASFSLNGYARETNPLLAREPGLINFTNVQSCGTATAVSLPCMFSGMGREEYDGATARGREGLLDVLSHAGLRVVWRNNNSGCKGVCDRIEVVDLSIPQPDAPHCTAAECYDERLLEGLPEMLRQPQRDLVVVLHQKGSHGPAYARRYPAGFSRFGPVCETTEFQKCRREEIVAAYDNTILYTDHVLSRAIGMLRRAAQEGGADTALLYVSDHGESLGERNLYLHGAPYLFAPPEQTRVPMMLWMSDAFSTRFGIDRTCLAARREQSFSHDNLFHSVLGMLDISTAIANPRLDIFRPCIRSS